MLKKLNLFKHNYFEIRREIMFYVQFLQKISLQNLNYWNVELQEAYFSPIEVDQRFKSLKK